MNFKDELIHITLRRSEGSRDRPGAGDVTNIAVHFAACIHEHKVPILKHLHGGISPVGFLWPIHAHETARMDADKQAAGHQAQRGTCLVAACVVDGGGINAAGNHRGVGVALGSIPLAVILCTGKSWPCDAISCSSANDGAKADIAGMQQRSLSRTVIN